MTATEDATAPNRLSGSLVWAAYSLGFSVGGFFDGILLHQVLQWHHLLSGIQDSPFDDLRVQIFADGLFHTLMYLIGAVGLFLLVKARRELSLPSAGRVLMAGGLIGFGAWHVLDSVLSHWITGIHRIKMDSDTPLLWDLIWFVAFGLIPLLIGWNMRPNGTSGPATSGRVTALLLVTIVLGAAPISALPPKDVTGAIVLFRPGLSESEIMTAVLGVGGRIIWTDKSGGLWALDFNDPMDARKLYGRGALLVSNSIFPAGCFSWSRAI